tara:strand:+ start:118 stop:456 length:339 start_codon:yes stop_codon:yes gene_type:complete
MKNKMPMKIDHILDDVVLLILDGHEPLKELGIDKTKIYVKIVGYDEYGLWAHHPSFPIPVIKNNKPQGEKNVNASMLIPWGFIASVVHFPGEEGFDFPDPFESSVGFDVEKK